MVLLQLGLMANVNRSKFEVLRTCQKQGPPYVLDEQEVSCTFSATSACLPAGYLGAIQRVATTFCSCADVRRRGARPAGVAYDCGARGACAVRS